MKSRLKMGIFLTVILFAASACGGGAQGSSPEMAAYGVMPTAGMAEMRMAHNDTTQYQNAEMFRADMDFDAGEPPQAGDFAVQERKLVKTADLRIRVEDPAAMEETVAGIMKKFDAWPAHTGVYENSRSYSIRVPSGSYDAMLAELTGLGRLLRRTENAEDVTLNYYDLESRLTTRRELLRTYQSYLARAANIDEIMTVESRISELQWEIDRTGTQFRNLANLVDYSTISLDITGPANTPSYSSPTLGEKLSELFGSFGEVASSALVVITGIVIYGIPAILILILLFWLLFGRVGLLKKLIRLAAGKR